MFCENCGHKNKENMSFCTQCGAPLDVIEQPQPVAPTSGKKGKKIGVIIGAAAAVALLGSLLFSMFGKNLLGDKGLLSGDIGLSGGRSYETVVDKYINYRFSYNAKGIVSLLPENYLNYILDKKGEDREEFIKSFQDDLEETREIDEQFYGEVIEVSHKIKDVEDITGDKLNNAKKRGKEMYDLNISAAKEVKTEIYIKGSYYEDGFVETIPVVKIGSSWYLIDIF
ncbi:MAG: zinc ribbon domain-containing protein [Clostridia bacterium]|nr:zinc ribbon domain-containing protein [Clostridia bacterium]